jgi:hypothetical protein
VSELQTATAAGRARPLWKRILRPVALPLLRAAGRLRTHGSLFRDLWWRSPREIPARLSHYYIHRWRIPLIHFDTDLGRKVFRDPTRFTEQIRGRCYLYHARLRSWQRDPDGAGAESWRLGYRRLGCVTSPEKMREVAAYLQEKVFDSPKAERFESHGQLVRISMQRAEEAAPELLQLLTGEVLDAVRRYYRSNFRLFNVGVWRNFNVPGIKPEDDTLSNNWHADLRRVDMVKVFIVASDVTEEDGPTHAITREWTREVLRRGFGHRRDYRLPVETIEHPDHLVQLTGPAGTALLVNTNLCFHRAGVPAAGRSRDIIEFRFVASPVHSLVPPAEEEISLRDRIV